MDKELIASATKKLDLYDIVLYESLLKRSDNLDPLSYPEPFEQQNKLRVKAERLTYEANGKPVDILRVLVELGARAIDKAKKTGDSEVCFIIEAAFMADYVINKKLKDAEIAEFAQYNAVHNVWPFWRQHVFQTVKTAKLPDIQVPLQRPLPMGQEKKTAKTTPKKMVIKRK